MKEMLFPFIRYLIILYIIIFFLRGENSKSPERKKAAWLSLTLGWIGFHKFYLGDPQKALYYVLTLGISYILALHESYKLFSMSDEDFVKYYEQEYCTVSNYTLAGIRNINKPAKNTEKKTIDKVDNLIGLNYLLKAEALDQREFDTLKKLIIKY